MPIFFAYTFDLGSFWIKYISWPLTVGNQGFLGAVIEISPTEANYGPCSTPDRQAKQALYFIHTVEISDRTHDHWMTDDDDPQQNVRINSSLWQTNHTM